MSYNLKVKDFGNGNYELSYYSKLIETKDTDVDIKKKKDKKYDIRFFMDEDEKMKYLFDDDDDIPFESDEWKAANEAKNRKDSMVRSKHKVYDYARSNKWDWFFTFTLSPDVVDRYDYDSCKKKLVVWLNNFKKRKCSTFEYLLVPEQHEDGAWHFHALAFGLAFSFFSDSGIVQKGRKIYNFNSYNLGFSTATKVSDSARASSYIVKYIEKSVLSIRSGKRYFCLQRCQGP